MVCGTQVGGSAYNGLAVEVDGAYRVEASAIWGMDDDNGETITVSLWKRHNGSDTKVSSAFLSRFYSKNYYSAVYGMDMVGLEEGDSIFLKIASDRQYADVVFSKLKLSVTKL